MRIKKADYHHGDLRRALVQTALKVIDQRGVDALTLKDLAVRTGVSPGAPYHHFADRSELLAAIAQEGFELLASAMRHASEAAVQTPAANLQALGCAYIMFAVSHRGHFKVMFRGDLHGKENAARAQAGERAFQLLCDAVQACQKAGAVPKGNPEPWVLHAWATVHGLSTLLVDGSLKKTTIPADQLPQLITSLGTQMFRALAAESESKTRATRATPQLKS
ncbi:hypothetical protein B9Z39_10850 [Limnohabitans sp. JirII-29]|nr:hypothetical protein B9Z39_10850 [Limnohabitans sp. JirII-29]